MNERSGKFRGVVGAFAAVLFCGATAYAQSAPTQIHTVRATGEATVSAAPDQAELTLAVVTQAPTAEQAAADNARQTEQAIVALKGVLEAGAEVKTAGYAIAPNYVYSPNGGEPKLNGHNATNTIRVTTHDLKRVGPTIDAAVKAGVNNVQGLQFSVRDDAALQAEALHQAAGNAQRRGMAIAEGLGHRVLNVLSAEEGSAVVRPVMYEAAVLRNPRRRHRSSPERSRSKRRSRSRSRSTDEWPTRSTIRLPSCRLTRMKTRRFGRTDWPVSEIGYGMWGMAGWTGSDDTTSSEALQHAVDLGCTFFDTAFAYGSGHSEELLGKLVRDNPSHKLYTATKIPPKNQKWPARRSFTLEDCYPPDHVGEFARKSLTNAGLEQFDLIQLHTWEDHWLDDDRFAASMAALKSDGVAAAVGLSLNRWEAWNGVRAVQSGLVDAVQVIYNIFDQSPEDELFPACREHDVAVIARVPFDEGTLTGTLTLESTWPEGDWRNTYFVPENLRKSVERAEALRPLVPEGSTMAEMALRFILAEPTVSTIIPGMRKVKHVETNLAASDEAPLSETLLAALRGHRWDRKPTDWSQ